MEPLYNTYILNSIVYKNNYHIIYKGGLNMRKVLLYTSMIIIGLFSFFIIKEHIQVSFYPLVRNYQKNKILNSLHDYKSIKTKNFTIYFKEEEQNIGEITGNIIEEHYEEVCSYFNHYPKGDTPIIIYDKEKDLINSIKLKKGIPAPLGVYYSGTINILSPNLWIGKDNLVEEYKETTPVVHEFTHLIVDEKTNGNYPLWLTEGLALFMEEKTIGFEWKDGIGETSSITLKDLNNDFEHIETEKAYRKSLEIVNHLNSKYRFDNINLLLDNLGMGSNINTSLKKVFKLGLTEIKD